MKEEMGKEEEIEEEGGMRKRKDQQGRLTFPSLETLGSFPKL